MIIKTNDIIKITVTSILVKLHIKVGNAVVQVTPVSSDHWLPFSSIHFPINGMEVLSCIPQHTHAVLQEVQTRLTFLYQALQTQLPRPFAWALAFAGMHASHSNKSWSVQARIPEGSQSTVVQQVDSGVFWVTLLKLAVVIVVTLHLVFRSATVGSVDGGGDTVTQSRTHIQLLGLNIPHDAGHSAWIQPTTSEGWTQEPSSQLLAATQLTYAAIAEALHANE